MSLSTGELLDEAIRLHRAGALAEAVARYNEVLRRDAGHADAHYYLAVAAHQQGDGARALESVRAALSADPRHARAHRLLGTLQSREGRLDDALVSFDRAIEFQPDQPEAHGARGDVLADLGRFGEAVASYDRALALRGDSAGEWSNRGAALSQMERHEDAVASFTRALELQPGLAEAHFNRGNALAKLGRYEAALGDYDRSLAIRPDNIGAQSNRGSALLKLGRLTEAAAALEAVLAADGSHISALVTYSTVLYRMGRVREALACCDRVLAADPDAVDALANRSASLLALDRSEEALAALRRILAVNPVDAEAKSNTALMLLVLGQLAEGWDYYRARFLTGENHARDYPQPEWDGAPAGTLMVWGEQGLGDQIIYAGMVPQLEGLVQRVVLEVEPRMVELFARSFPAVTVVGGGPGTPLHQGPIDAQIAIGNLGLHLRRSFDRFPRRERGYLAADAARSSELRARLSAGGRKVIGLSWVSRAELGRAKSALLTDLEPVLRLSGCRFVDLQYGDTQKEREAIARDRGLQVERLPDVDTLRDIDGLAALISACDAVVTVSNTTAHLAGALGVPTWVVVPYGQGRIWYWFKSGDRSPWYPRVRVLRQREGETWTGLFRNVAAEVAALGDRA